MPISVSQYNLVVRNNGKRAADDLAGNAGGLSSYGAGAIGFNSDGTAFIVQAASGRVQPPPALMPNPDSFYGDDFSVPIPVPQPSPNPPTSVVTAEGGLELRPPGEEIPGPIGGAIGGIGGIVAAGGFTAALALLRTVLGTATRVTAAQWNRLPGWAQAALTTGGIIVGSELATDLVGLDDAGIIPGFGLPDGGGFPTLPGTIIIGSWNANGVRFYRLSDGKLAVQKKNGSWKVWRPKKPIVLYAGGAGNLRTMLRADRALNNQAKALKKVLNRRAPTRRSPTKPAGAGQTVRNINVDN